MTAPIMRNAKCGLVYFTAGYRTALAQMHYFCSFAAIASRPLRLICRDLTRPPSLRLLLWMLGASGEREDEIGVGDLAGHVSCKKKGDAALFCHIRC